jgi:catechol 2,3-dioxygenase-like lactoylglutathione lyase family enzyme
MRHVGIAATLVLAAVAALAQTPQVQQQLPLMVGTLLVVDDLDKTEEFYHHLLGLEGRDGDPRARLGWYPVNPFLTDMYGVEGNSRNFFLRIPGSDLILEPEQFNRAGGKALNPRLQDPGAAYLMLTANNINVLVDRLEKGGAKVVDRTPGAAWIQDFNGFYVKLTQRDAQIQPGAAPPPTYITGVEIGVSVGDLAKTSAFYRDVLGLETSATTKATLKGMPYQEAVVVMPDKTPQIRLLEFNVSDRKPIHPKVADPNSILLRMNVRNMDSIIPRVQPAGGRIMNLSGRPFVNGRNRWLIVSDPNDIHLQLVERN